MNTTAEDLESMLKKKTMELEKSQDLLKKARDVIAQTQLQLKTPHQEDDDLSYSALFRSNEPSTVVIRPSPNMKTMQQAINQRSASSPAGSTSQGSVSSNSQNMQYNQSHQPTPQATMKSDMLGSSIYHSGHDTTVKDTMNPFSMTGGSEWSTQSPSMQFQMTHMSMQNKTLKDQNSDLQEQNNTLQDELDNKQSFIDKLLVERKNHLEKNVPVVEKLEGEIKEKNELIFKSLASIDSLDQQLKSERQKRTSLEQEFQSLDKTTKTDMQEMRSQREVEMNNLKQAFDQEMTRLKEHYKDKLNELIQKLNTVKSESTVKNQQLQASTNSQLQTLSAQLNASQRLNKDLQERVESTRDKISNVEQSLNQRTEELMNQKDAFQALQEKYNGLSKDYKNALQQVEELKTIELEKQTKIHRLNESISRYESTFIPKSTYQQLHEENLVAIKSLQQSMATDHVDVQAIQNVFLKELRRLQQVTQDIRVSSTGTPVAQDESSTPTQHAQGDTMLREENAMLKKQLELIRSSPQASHQAQSTRYELYKHNRTEFDKILLQKLRTRNGSLFKHIRLVQPSFPEPPLHGQPDSLSSQISCEMEKLKLFIKQIKYIVSHQDQRKDTSSTRMKSRVDHSPFASTGDHQDILSKLMKLTDTDHPSKLIPTVSNMLDMVNRSSAFLLHILDILEDPDNVAVNANQLGRVIVGEDVISLSQLLLNVRSRVLQSARVPLFERVIKQLDNALSQEDGSSNIVVRLQMLVERCKLQLIHGDSPLQDKPSTSNRFLDHAYQLFDVSSPDALVKKLNQLYIMDQKHHQLLSEYQYLTDSLKSQLGVSHTNEILAALESLLNASRFQGVIASRLHLPPSTNRDSVLKKLDQLITLSSGVQRAMQSLPGMDSYSLFGEDTPLQVSQLLQSFQRPPSSST